MISLVDFQPLSVAKINLFFINNRGFTERYFSDKVHAILIEIEEVPVQTMLRDGASFFNRTKIFPSAFKYRIKYSHINL